MPRAIPAWLASCSLPLLWAAQIDAGLDDRQLGLLNYFHHVMRPRNSSSAETASEATANTDAYDWEEWFKADDQTGLGAYRYQAAFMAYSAAALAGAYTPAYTEVAETILRDAFARMVAPRVWEFWNEPGHCGWPWRQICSITNRTMCRVSAMDGETRCPDPVYNANIMYSGHLAQVGALYELFSVDSSLSTLGWDFSHDSGDFVAHYNLPDLLGRLQEQERLSKTGGFSCEPSMVYLPCNTHAFAAQRLYDSKHGTKFSSEAPRWADYVRSTAGRKHQKTLAGEAFFETVFQDNLQPRFHWLDVGGLPGGCAANDGWVLSWLPSWFDESDTMLASAAESLNGNKDWTSDKVSGGSYLYQHWPYSGHLYTSEMATSFYMASGTDETRRKSALRYMDFHFGNSADLDGDGTADAYFYNASNDGTSMWVTANMALGSIDESASLLRSLYGPESPLLLARQLPHLHHVSPGIPTIWVRGARFDNSTSRLRFVLSPKGNGSVDATAIVASDNGIGADKCWNPLEVRQNGISVTDWTVQSAALAIGPLSLTVDTVVEVMFSHHCNTALI